MQTRGMIGLSALCALLTATACDAGTRDCGESGRELCTSEAEAGPGRGAGSFTTEEVAQLLAVEPAVAAEVLDDFDHQPVSADGQLVWKLTPADIGELDEALHPAAGDESGTR